jgi:hypothetical protein
LLFHSNCPRSSWRDPNFLAGCKGTLRNRIAKRNLAQVQSRCHRACHDWQLECDALYLVILSASLLLFLAVAVTFANSRYFSLFHPFTLYCLFHGLVFVIRPFLS